MLRVPSSDITGLVAAGLESEQAIGLMNRAAIVCLGPITEDTARECGLTVTAAGEYTVNGLVETLVNLYATHQEIDR